MGRWGATVPWLAPGDTAGALPTVAASRDHVNNVAADHI